MWTSFLPLALLAPFADALLRFPCSQLVTQRFDPLVTPGQVSPHIHQIIGGIMANPHLRSATIECVGAFYFIARSQLFTLWHRFNLSMDPSLDLSSLATCTTCRFKEDNSNYWTAVMFFKHPNGSYIRVPQIANAATGAPNGGMTVYYIQPQSGERVTAFRKGFRMIVGNPMLRTRTVDPNSAQGRALTFRCWGAQGANDPQAQSAPGTGPLDTIELPNRACAGGIRSNTFFPSCWDGVNLDTPDHSSHVAYPLGTVPAAGLFFNPGACPSTHPVRLPLLFMETVWDTRPFNSMWPTDGSQPFVFSMGDPTGYGHHGDYVFGWEGDSLQRAMDTCTDIGGNPPSCRALTVLSDADINRCTQSVQVNERTTGYLPALPGCNPIQPGPAQATMPASCDAVSTTGGIGGSVPTPPPAPGTTQVPPAPGTTLAPPPPPPAPTQPPAPQAPAVPKWGQCGGIGWTGGTTCVAGSTCQRQNDW
ncbi:unnamed protein product [Cyclocybe aegerita]|uniref:CBM1 domain-containing protein n=1 Tax=Cyclocybe aegerita TaxID=1973307 RepID=A0A8S0X1P6_CYCAE|nr:unnamed protein product [Cyclocybe aegerita]